MFKSLANATDFCEIFFQSFAIVKNFRFNISSIFVISIEHAKPKLKTKVAKREIAKWRDCIIALLFTEVNENIRVHDTKFALDMKRQGYKTFRD